MIVSEMQEPRIVLLILSGQPTLDVKACVVLYVIGSVVVCFPQLYDEHE